MMESLENCEHDWVKAKRTPSKYRRWFCKNCGTVYTFTGELDDELREKNLTKGQKLTLTGEQLEGQPGLRQDIIRTMWDDPIPLDEECDLEATNVG